MGLKLGSVILVEEHRKVFWPKNGEVKEWRKLRNMELGDLSSQIIGWVVNSRSAWSAGHAARVWKTNAYRALVGETCRKEHIARSGCKWR